MWLLRGVQCVNGGDNMNNLTMGELAALFAIKKSTIRYYVEEGLLRPRRNNQNDYYLFSEEDIYRLYQILVLKEAGISIKKIKHGLNQESVLNSLEQAKQAVKTKITRLKQLESKLGGIIEDNKRYVLNEAVYLEYPDRYLEKISSDDLEDGKFLYYQNTTDIFDSLNYLAYRFSDQRNFDVCMQSTKENADFLYPEGVYVSKTVSAVNEQTLFEQIDLFLSDPLFALTDSTIEDLLVYENINCSLAYSEKMLFTMEVKM